MFYLQSDDSLIVQASIKALDKIFCHFAANDSLSEKGPVQETEADKKVRTWIRERYQEFQDYLFTLLSAEQVSLQENALVTLMHFLQVEGQYPLSKPSEEKNSFPSHLLEVISEYITFFVLSKFVFI